MPDTPTIIEDLENLDKLKEVRGKIPDKFYQKVGDEFIIDQTKINDVNTFELVEAYKRGLKKLGISDNDVRFMQKADEFDAKLRTKARNMIFDKIAAGRPVLQEMPENFRSDRIIIKNLLDRNTDLQKTFLKRQGFQVREKEGQLQLKRPSENQWKVVDPKGLDRWDFVDIMGDVVEGIADAYASGIKISGLLGAAETGGLSLVAGGLVGGSVTGGVEAIKQGIALAIGAREEGSLGEIGEAAALGTIIPVGLGAVAKGIRRGAKGVGRAARFLAKPRVRPKPDKAAIEEAAKVIGAKPTPSMLFEGGPIEEFESAIFQMKKIPGRKLVQQIDDNKKAAQETAQAILDTEIKKTKFEVGVEAEEEIMKAISEKIKPAEEIYNRLANKFQDIPLFEEEAPETLVKAFDIARKDYLFSNKATNLLNQFEDKIGLIKNLDMLKTFRTNVRMTKNPSSMDFNEMGVLDRLEAAATKTRNDTLLELSFELGDETFKQARIDIKKADSIYREAIQDVKKVLLRPRDKIKLGLKGEAKKFFENVDEVKRMDKILTLSSPAKIERLKKAFPVAYEKLRTAKMTELSDRLIDAKGNINLRQMTKHLDAIPQETKKLIFDEAQNLKLDALKIYLRSLPEKVGKSDTPRGQVFLHRVGNLMDQLRDLTRVETIRMLTDENVESGIAGMAARFVETKKARAGAFISTSPLIRRLEEKNK